MTISVDLSPEDEAFLDRMSEEDKVPRANLVQTAIPLYLDRCRRFEATGAFGLWKDRNEDSLAYLDRIRDGR